MYASIREHMLLAAFPTIRQGLDELGLKAVELVYNRDSTVCSILGENSEPHITLDSSSGVDRILKELYPFGGKVTALLLSNNFGTKDLDAEIDWVISAVRAAERLGAPAIRVDAIMQGEREMPLKERAQHFSDCMARVLDATGNINVDAGIENHGFQGNDPDFLDLVLSTVNSPRVGLTLDTGNFYWAGHPLSKVYKIIEHFAPRVKHTHVKNIKYPEDVREIQRELGWKYGEYVVPIREGDIDHARVAQILKSAEYDRDLCIEDESLGKWEDVEQRASVLKDDARHLIEIL